MKVRELTEATFRSVRRRTTLKTRQRGNALESKETSRLRPLRTKGGKVKSQTFFFETSGSDSGDTWIQKVKAHVRPNSRKRSVWGTDVTMVCNCPAWKWGGSDHWALEDGYLYGLPRSNRSFPKVRDPKHRQGACKHVISVSNLIRDGKMKIDE